MGLTAETWPGEAGPIGAHSRHASSSPGWQRETTLSGPSPGTMAATVRGPGEGETSAASAAPAGQLVTGSPEAQSGAQALLPVGPPAPAAPPVGIGVKGSVRPAGGG